MASFTEACQASAEETRTSRLVLRTPVGSAGAKKIFFFFFFSRAWHYSVLCQACLAYTVCTNQVAAAALHGGLQRGMRPGWSTRAADGAIFSRGANTPADRHI